MNGREVPKEDLPILLYETFPEASMTAVDNPATLGPRSLSGVSRGLSRLDGF
jgi:hypothetical protein